ncbi:MAG TPA: prolyl oligopeptidase family serine peptidase [Steroidobacteraceae bacterium]|nr:prolyl oligopeptidase family serine peptidase [Steroidobacteraceae bacterium]
MKSRATASSLLGCRREFFRLSGIVGALALHLFAYVPAFAGEQLNCGLAVPNGRPIVVSARLAGVPAILRVPDPITKPPIIMWHGFGPPADARALMAALPLDEVPAVKVYLDLPFFGARAPHGGTGEMIRRQTQDVASLIFEPVVMGAAGELPAVVAALRARRCAGADGKIGLFGFSAGGAATLVALAQREARVSAAVTLNASTGLSASIQALERATKRPYTWTPHARLLARRSDAVLHAADISAGNPPVALLLIHGADDQTVSPSATANLYDVLRPYYRRDRAGPRLRLDILPGLSHSWGTASTDPRLERQIASWFNRFL